MYKSPIEIMQKEMRVQMENGIIKAVQDVGITVDKAELLKALAYDREQYQKGFADGRKAGHEWISVEDGLPSEGVSVAVYINEGNGAYWIQTAYLNGGKWRIPGEYVVDRNITHWMPLPETPEED